MRTITLTVDANGRVEIPDTRPGQTLTIQVPEAQLPDPVGLTRRTARTLEEKRAVIAEVKRLAEEIRETAPRDWLEMNYDDWPYDEYGLPK
jgi:hypothetical protein